MVLSILTECQCRTVLVGFGVAERGSCSEGPFDVMADMGDPADGGLSNLKNSPWVRLGYAVLHRLYIIRLFSSYTERPFCCV